MAMFITLAWLLVASILCIVGNILDSKLLLGVGGVMVVLTTMVYSFAY